MNYVGKNTARNNIWRCSCECGKEIIAEYSDIHRGKIKSCGCLKVEKSIEINSLPEGESAFNSLYSTYKRRAETLNIEFNISKERFRILTKNKCKYCHSEPSNVKKTKKSFGHYVYNGVDRLDNNIGYTVENSVACCMMCNYAKRTWSLEEFNNWIDKLIRARLAEAKKGEGDLF